MEKYAAKTEVQLIDFFLVTYQELANLDPDDVLLADELSKRGFNTRAVVWDDPAIDWSSARVTIMRSAWDYHLKRDQFLSWIETVDAASRLINSASLMRWNCHKGYLRELERRNVPIIPTLWVDRGECAQPSHVGCLEGWSEVVVKPAVGLATFGVKRFSLEEGDGVDAAIAHANRLAETNEVMVQPFMTSVGNYGERALVFIGGEHSHTVRKTEFQPMAIAGLAGEKPVIATKEEIAVGRKALSALPETPLYARVDLVADEAGHPLLMELELIEPSLFFGTHPGSAARMADALTALTACS